MSRTHADHRCLPVIQTFVCQPHGQKKGSLDVGRNTHECAQAQFSPISARARFATGNSDLLTEMKAFNECVRLRAERKPQSAVKNFCEEVRVSCVIRLYSQSLSY
jgi:hypothetical protein